MHKTSGEEELWSTHWLWERPAVKCLFSFREYKTLNLHVQNAGEEIGAINMDRKPMLRKIRFLMACVWNKCKLHYHLGPDIALDEVRVQMSGQFLLKKKLCFKGDPVFHSC